MLIGGGWLSGCGCAICIVLQETVGKLIALGGIALMALASGFCIVDLLVRHIPITKWEMHRAEKTIREDAVQRIVNERLKTYRLKPPSGPRDIN